MTSYPRTGHSPAVAPHPPTGGWCSARVDGSDVIVEINAVEAWRSTVGLFHAVSIGCQADGTLVVAGAMEVSGADTAFLVTATATTSLGLPSAAVRGVYLTPDAKRVAVCTSPYVCTIRTLVPTGVADLPVTNPFPGGDSQGIIGLVGNVPTYAIDPATGGYRQKRGLTIPRDVGPWTFGQIAGPDDAGAWHDGVIAILQAGQTFEQSACAVGDQAVVGIERDLNRVLFVRVPPWTDLPTVPTDPPTEPPGPPSAPAPPAPPPPPLRPRPYPHVDGISDWRAQQSVRLLWDRAADHGDRLDSTQASVTELQSTIAAQQEELASIRRASGEALALAQKAARGGTPEGPTTGPGSFDEPIVAMSSDPAQIAIDVKSSYDHFAPIAIAAGTTIGAASYWIDKASHKDQLTGGKWYLGHNKYWEDRMDCFNPGFPSAADPAGGSLPALY